MFYSHVHPMAMNNQINMFYTVVSFWQVSLQGQWVPLSGIVMPFLGGSGMYPYLGGSGSEIVMLTLVAVAVAL